MSIVPAHLPMSRRAGASPASHLSNLTAWAKSRPLAASPACGEAGKGRRGRRFCPPRVASRVIDPPIIPMERIPAQHFLATVEQGSDIAAGRLVAEFLHPILNRDGRVLHDIKPGIDLED